ncbi:hypothetical protein [Microbulbifer guangxiensis]|uniref:hypothetical protein n=1 Tax=Microbulbifer guangxiensis TaxID=2904249 RepID=UPI001F25FDF6|nr:hypothetical protein [Microbulbifer guangxiensis]
MKALHRLFAVILLHVSSGSVAADITSEQATNLVEEQFVSFFTDCEKFTATFSPNFKYCDAESCVTNKNTLLEVCEATADAPNIIHRLDVLPASFPEPYDPNYNPFLDGVDYSNITATGLQTVSLPLDPQNPDQLIPLCFNFAIREKIALDATADRGYGSTLWQGFYTISISLDPSSPCYPFLFP